MDCSFLEVLSGGEGGIRILSIFTLNSAFFLYTKQELQ